MSGDAQRRADHPWTRAGKEVEVRPTQSWFGEDQDRASSGKVNVYSS